MHLSFNSIDCNKFFGYLKYTAPNLTTFLSLMKISISTTSVFLLSLFFQPLSFHACDIKAVFGRSSLALVFFFLYLRQDPSLSKIEENTLIGSSFFILIFFLFFFSTSSSLLSASTLIYVSFQNKIFHFSNGVVQFYSSA